MTGWRTTLFVGLLLVGLHYVHSEGSAIPEIYAKGTHGEIGYEVGKILRSSIKDFIIGDEYLVSSLLPFVQSPTGKQYYDSYLSVVQKVFPQYYLELQGIADGALVGTSELFTQVISPELSSLMTIKNPQGSSDVFVNYPDRAAIGHNVDGDPLKKGRSYILRAVVLNETGGQVIENFTAYSFAAGLPGNAFGFNGEGLVFTANALYPAIVELNKIPSNFLNRAMLAVKNQQELEQLLNNAVGAAYGFNVNFADLKNSSYSMTSYEVAPVKGEPKSIVSRYTIGVKTSPGPSAYNTTGNYYHFNMYNHTSVTQIQQEINSSQHRLARAAQLPVPQDLIGIANILGDTADPNFPIFRSFRAVDQQSTVATGTFDLTYCRLHVYTKNPKNTTDSLATLRLPMCQPKKGPKRKG